MVKNSFIFLFVFIVSLIGGIFFESHASAQQHPSGIVSYWKFDESSGSVAYDLIGTNHGAVYKTTWTSGQVDGALSFNKPMGIILNSSQDTLYVVDQNNDTIKVFGLREE